MNVIRWNFKYSRALAIAAVAICVALASASPALATFEIFFDENGNGAIGPVGGPFGPIHGAMEPDPASGLVALTYHLPELVINGDVAVVEPGQQQISDGLRFTNAGGDIDRTHATADRLIYFSEQPEPGEQPPFDLADTGFPGNFFTDFSANGTLTEVGSEGHNGFDWFPGGNVYHGISDVPEPSTVVLMGVGLLGLVGYTLRRRRQVH